MDPGWITALCGLTAAIGTAVGVVVANYMKGKREARADEIAVLQGHIKDLRAEAFEAKVTAETRVKEQGEEMKKLKDEHTACLIKTERLTQRVLYLEEKLGIAPKEHPDETRPAG